MNEGCQTSENPQDGPIELHGYKHDIPQEKGIMTPKLVQGVEGTGSRSKAVSSSVTESQTPPLRAEGVELQSYWVQRTGH